jgi:hypothetical protein
MNVFFRIIVALMGFVTSSVYAQTSVPKPQKFEVGTVRLLNTPTVLSATSKGKLIWKIKSPGNICAVLDHKQAGFVLNLCNSILLLNHQNGKVIWHRIDIVSERIELFAKDRLLVETTLNGASWSTLTTVIGAATGVGIIESPGTIVSVTSKYAFLLSDGLTERTSRDRLWFSKIDAANNKVESKTFQLSPRPGCGTEDNLTDSKVDHADDQFVYAQVTDLCGEFDIKLEWTKGR